MTASSHHAHRIASAIPNVRAKAITQPASPARTPDLTSAQRVSRFRQSPAALAILARGLKISSLLHPPSAARFCASLSRSLRPPSLAQGLGFSRVYSSVPSFPPMTSPHQACHRLQP
ncbi:hypothetical protein V8C35DRAFT_310024 [Trichoderma chlorosporum]